MASVQKRHLPVVYWFMIVALLICTMAASLLIVRLMFTLRILIAPGPVLLLGAFSLISIVTGALFSQVFVRSVTRPILEMSEAAGRIAQGDFDVTLQEETFALEIEEMKESFTVMARELAATEMLRSDFVSNVSHEIKTPLASIVGYATLLQRPDLPADQQRACVDKIQAGAERLSRLTDDVLLLSRLEHHEGDAGRQAFSLSEQLRESVLEFEGLLDAGARRLEVDLEEVDYLGNAELLSHVWQNLLSNALKFTEEGDAIGVRLRRRPGAEGAPGVVEVQVSDTGIGMSEQECARAFERFYQADRSHATEGNGLGLALCKRIVGLHGGTITAHGEPGAGTTFVVELPLPAEGAGA